MKAKNTLLLFLLFAFILGIAIVPSEAKRPSAVVTKKTVVAKKTKLRAKLKVLARQISSVKSQLHETKQKQFRVTDQLQRIEGRLAINQSHIRQVRARVESTQTEIQRVSLRLRATEIQLAKHNRILAGRLRTVHRHGTISFISVLLASRSFSDYADRKYYVSRVVNGDVSLINQIKRETAQVQEYKETLVDRQHDLLSDKKQLFAENAAILEESKEKRELLAKVESQRAEYEQALNELEQNSQQIESMIVSMQATPQGRARAMQPFHGGFIRPVGGPVTCPFGPRMHPILHVVRMHTGVDLGAHAGTPIHAAASGVVIHAGWWGAYGNAVIIDHGGGVSTLYGHCSVLKVHTGEKITQGEVIGLVGSTGWSTGPHLHFEVRKNGKPVRPL